MNSVSLIYFASPHFAAKAAGKGDFATVLAGVMGKGREIVVPTQAEGNKAEIGRIERLSKKLGTDLKINPADVQMPVLLLILDYMRMHDDLIQGNPHRLALKLPGYTPQQSAAALHADLDKLDPALKNPFKPLMDLLAKGEMI